MKQGIYFLRRRNEKFKSDLILPQGGGGGGGGRGDEGRRGYRRKGKRKSNLFPFFPSGAEKLAKMFILLDQELCITCECKNITTLTSNIHCQFLKQESYMISNLM